MLYKVFLYFSPQEGRTKGGILSLKLCAETPSSAMLQALASDIPLEMRKRLTAITTNSIATFEKEV